MTATRSRRVYVRRFDHDEARRRHAAGETIQKLAEEYGVTKGAIRRACIPHERKVRDRYAETLKTAGRCDDCGGVMSQASRYGGARRCTRCAAIAQATTVRPGTLRCVTCKEWKPDDEFPRDKVHIARRGRHRQCRPCNTAEKRAWRERNRVPCSHGCGRMVDAKNRRDPDKPFECGPCSLERITGRA